VPNQLEIRPPNQVRDVRFLTRKKVVDANNVVSPLDEFFAKVRTEKTGAPRDQNTLNFCHCVPY
jgi:hypothetical protein